MLKIYDKGPRNVSLLFIMCNNIKWKLSFAYFRKCRAKRLSRILSGEYFTQEKIIFHNLDEVP